jgi:predicted XRE-type DNA-binding protein
MAKRVHDGIEVELSSGNVFAGLGLPDAEQLKIKSGLVIEITRAVRRLGLTQEDAGRRMGISQARVSGLMRGDFSNLSKRKLMECLNRLGCDIEIKLTPAPIPSDTGAWRLPERHRVAQVWIFGPGKDRQLSQNPPCSHLCLSH